MDGPEFETWVPMLKNNVPRVVIFGAPVLGLAVYAVYKPADALNALFYLGLLVVGNLLLFVLERWSAAKDRAAVAAGVPTRGWGVDPSKPGLGWTDRLRVQREEVDAARAKKE